MDSVAIYEDNKKVNSSTFFEEQEEICREKRMYKSCLDDIPRSPSKEPNYFRYVFLTFHDLFDMEIHSYLPAFGCDFQTVGRLVWSGTCYNLCPLVRKNPVIKTQHIDNKILPPDNELFARVFGHFWCDVDKYDRHSTDGMNTYLEVRLNYIAKLDSLQGARRLEDALYKINYELMK